MRLLTRSDIQRAIPMRDTIEILKRAFADLSTGRANVPPRLALPQDKHDGVTLLMPAYLLDAEAFAVKIVSIHKRNPERDLPLIQALVVLFDPTTGKPLAALEGGSLTALRTGAASGVATDLLARQEAEVVAIFGAGVQARTQLLGVTAARALKRCWIYARQPEHVQIFLAEMQPQLGTVELLAARSPAQAVREAHVICAATTSATPVFDGAELQPGTHINAVGSFKPSAQEIDCTTLQRAAKIVIDEHAGARSEAGDILAAIAQGAIAWSNIYGEIGEIAAGLKAGREREDEITYFKSVGNAVQDAAVAQAIYQRAVAENLGVEFDLLS
jgi:ornithine cyclodeaminase/alanine dehydrogenase-like protein (mu-crystallin family)